MTEPRFWILDTDWSGIDTSQSNRINEVSAAVGHPVVGIVDEQAGGVIGWADPSTAEVLVELSNTQFEGLIACPRCGGELADGECSEPGCDYPMPQMTPEQEAEHRRAFGG